jgi:hypothetical protein
MTIRTRWLAAMWLIVAASLAVGTTVGGDTSIVTGFLWLAWTAPIGLIWQFLIYDVALRVVPVAVANVGGLALVLALSYGFWLHFLPGVIRFARRKPSM